MRCVTVLLAFVLAASACGGPTRPSAAPTAGYVAKLRAYAKCMRSHGADMPDPQVGPDGQVQLGAGVHGNQPTARIQATVKAAQAACQSLQPTDEDRANAFATQIATLRDLAKCMRAHGVTRYPDPSAAGEISLSRAGVDKNSAAYRAAQKACGGPG